MTSGLCAYKDATGYLAGTKSGHVYYDGSDYKGYEFNNGEFRFTEIVDSEAAEGVGVTSAGWYHRVSDSSWVKCDDQSDEAHPTEQPC